MPVDVSGEPVVLLRSRIWPAVLVPAALLAGIVAYGIWARRFPLDLLTIFAVTSLVSAVLFRGNAVLADDIGLLVRHRGRLSRSYRWDQIREAGPNSPTVVGKVWLWRTTHEVRERIEAVLRQHGVTVIDKRGRRISGTDNGSRPR